MSDKLSNCRGFVQLPTIVNCEGNELVDPSDVEPTLLFKSGQCFVPHCAGIECCHIRLAATSIRQSSPLEITDSGLELMGEDVASELRSVVEQLRSEGDCPLVQRVTHNVMAIKCPISPQHPLGFLHVAFPCSVKDPSLLQQKLGCGCFFGKVTRISHMS